MNISLVPFCGLGNRLNVISSALALVAQTDHEVTVFWEQSWDCYARWDQLFQPLEGVRVVPLEAFYLKRRGWKWLGLPMFLRLFLFDHSYKARKIWNDDFLLHTPSAKAKIYIEGNKRFCPVTLTSMLSRYYRPIPALHERIEALAAQYAPYTVGVHIRRTDHREATQDNPLEAFVAAMHQQVEEHPDCRFYVATDDVEVKTLLVRTFPDRVVMQECVLDRDSVEGIQAAVVEMYALGRTSLIIGSRGSTFSEFAAMLYDTPIIYITEHQTRTDYK